MERITSLDLYLHFPAGKIIETQCLEDIGCGIYPCYYMNCRDRLKVSASVTPLIFDSKSFYLNQGFNPPNYLAEETRACVLLRKINRRLFSYLRLPTCYPRRTEWYVTWQTIDNRIKKLRPFEVVTPKHNAFTFNPDFALRDKEVIISKTVHFLKKSINDVEKRFPHYDHIVMAGGKDSRMIYLIPKINKQKWHIFSAEPNYPLVLKWAEENNITLNRIFRHNNQNEESVEDFKRKVICGDLYSDPKHIRWMPTLKRIAEVFNNKCIFWAGTAADAIYSFHPDFHRIPKKYYFHQHITRIHSWQGNYHQVFKNFVGSALLSPYHSREIWEELYQHMDPSVITKGIDLRDEISRELFGKPVKWESRNPGPTPYRYDFSLDPYKLYTEYIKENQPKTIR